MKKFLAIFPLCLLLSGLVFPRSEVKATEFVLPNSYEALPYIDLITALQSGATFDLTGDISSVEDFLEKAALKKVTGNTSDFSNGIITTSDRLWSEIKNEYMRRTIDNDFSEFLIPWHKSDFATNIGYDIKWYQRYLNDLYSDVEIPQLPYEYSFLENSDELYFSGSQSFYNMTLPIQYNYVMQNPYSFTVGIYYGGLSSRRVINNSNLYFSPLELLTINVYNNPQNSISVSYGNINYYTNWLNGSLNSQTTLRCLVSNNVIKFASDSSYNSNYTTTFPDLPTAINYIYDHFSNFNLYVNGDAWILVGQDSEIVDFPDVFGTDYDDLAYDVVVPTDDNLAFDICKLYGWLYDNITQGLDNYLTWDDLISGGIIIDTDTDEPISDTDARTRTKSVPVSKVVDDTLVGEGDGGNITPSPDPERIFPILPIEVSPIDNALGGSTILAEIVDATQNALPSELIDAFWGIVFILFIIGIIWTFHK